MSEIILHIGIHKTASTLLQKLFSDQHNDLRKLGIEFLPQYYFMGMDLMKKSPLSSDMIAEYKQKFQIDRQKFKGSKLLISSETFAGSPFLSYMNTCQVVSDLKLIVGDVPIKVISCIRRQDTFIESWYHQSIKQGGSDTFTEYIEKLDLEHFNWESLLEQYSNQFSQCKIEVIPYELSLISAEQFALDFFRRMDSRWNQQFKIAKVENPSLTPKGVELQRIANGVLDTEEKKKLRLFLQKEFSKPTSDSFNLLSEQLRLELLNHYLVSNQNTFAKYAPNTNQSLLDYYGIQ